MTILFILFSVVACGGSSSYHKGDRALAANAADVAEGMVGKRYKYGGNNPGKGFDCSGLVQYSYLEAGRKVPRSTKLQRRHSQPVSVRNMKKGDLLFFNQLNKKSSHVGMYLGNNKFIHAPSSGKRVRIDEISAYWKKHLASVRRFP